MEGGNSEIRRLKKMRDLMDFICPQLLTQDIGSSSTKVKEKSSSRSRKSSSRSKSSKSKSVDYTNAGIKPKPSKSNSVDYSDAENLLKSSKSNIVDYNNPENLLIPNKSAKARLPPLSVRFQEPEEELRTVPKGSVIASMPSIKWNFEKGEAEPVEVIQPKWMEPFNCNGRFEARFDRLPMELILIIFKQITASDRLAAGTTCKRWMEASHYYEPFLDQTYYHFDRIEFGDHVDPFKNFSEGYRCYPRLTFTQVEFNKHSDFWELHGLWITELTLRSCKIRKKKFISIMRNLLNLRRLELMQCDELFKNWTLEYNNQEPMFPFFLFCLKHLSLSGCDYFNEYHFERFMVMAPNLQSIDVSNCFINLYLSKRITMLDRVMKLINKNRYIMKALNLSDTPCVDDFAWHLLCEIEDLQLTHFTIAYGDRVPLKDPGIMRFFSIQTKLTHLDLTSSIGLNDECLQLIITGCTLLHTLKIRRCWLISDEGVVDMHTLPHLRVLDISNCERISDYGIMTGIVGKRPRQMNELYLSLLKNLSDSTLYYILVNLRNIQILDLDSSTNCLTDASIQYISCYLHNLKELNVVACTNVSHLGCVS